MKEEKPAVYSSPTEPFVDPAIVSYDRPEGTNFSATKIPIIESRSGSPIDYSTKTVTVKSVTTTQSAQHQPTISLLTRPKEGFIEHNTLDEFVSSATLGGSFNDLSIQDPDNIQDEEFNDQKSTTLPREENTAAEGNRLPSQPSQKPAGRRNRRGTQKGKAAIVGREILGKAQPQYTQPDRPRDQREGKTVKEWSRTSLTVATSHLDQSPNKPPSRPDMPATKRKSRRHLKVGEDQNGWATGEASDIQDMGDFDFQGNLSKFDKRKVFEKIRQEDTTADEERLVSFNRVHARPGTNGGKNLHYSENVLDSLNPNDPLAWNNGDSDDDEINESKLSSRRSSRKNVHRRKPPSRKGSAIQSGDQNLSGLLPLPDQIAKARYPSNDPAGSPKVFSNPSIARFPNSNDLLKPSLRILPSNRICPSLTPLQMVELEQLATSELGLTEDMITENAARGIAETARKLVNVQPAINSTNDQGSPLIFILAGNHRSGARAIAAGRHLRNHSTRVVVSMLGHEREADLIDSVRRQLSIYRNCGGLTSKPDELVHSLQHLQAPKSLIVDALLGIHSSFDDLRTDDQTAYSHLSKWANSAKFSALSIDIPSGLDASSGKSLSRIFQPVKMLILKLKVCLPQRLISSSMPTSFYLSGPLRLAF